MTNPLKVTWFHMRARVRLYHIWLVVQLGLHRKAPSRLRSKLVKYAGWLEAAVLTASTSKDSDIKVTIRNDIAQHYDKLQTDMAKLQQTELRRSLTKEDIDSVKDSFLHLLDICGIKDADIPNLTEPVPLRQTQQTLITSFGIMSKSLSGNSAMTTPPQRTRRHVRRDPASYADMLIEQLMADASPDSDTSPPSAAGEATTSSKTIAGGDSTPSSSNALSDPQREVLAPHRVQQPLALRLDTHNPSTSSQYPHHPSSPASDARYGWLEDNLALPSHPHHIHHHHHNLIQGRPTSDSGITASGSSHTIASSTTMSPPIQDPTLTVPTTNPNTTTGSTPELPAVVAASSQSLDIPFASFFGKLDNLNSNSTGDKKPLPAKVNIPPQDFEEVSSNQQNCYNFPLKYSHSYARELQRLETEMFSDLQLEPDYIPSPKSIPKHSAKRVDSHYVFHEPLVVILPEKGDKDGEKHNYNNLNNNNYKPSLEDKSGVVESEQDSPKPPIPPRVPLTKERPTRIGQFVVAAEPIGNVWLSHKPTESSSDSPCNMSWSYIDSPPQLVPSNSMVSSSLSTGKAHIREKKKCQTVGRHHPKSPLRPPTHQAPTSASKRRKANDKSPMPIEHSATTAHHQQPSKSVRQRLFLSPTRTHSPLRPSMGLASLVGSNEPLQPASGSSPITPRMERMRRNKRHSPAMRRLMQEKENNLLSPSKAQSSLRKPFSDVYNIQLNESDPLTTSSNSLSPSENYAKSSETSPDMPLPSREEELLDRHAYYEDFTVDRDHRFDSLTPAQKKGLLRKSTQENFYTLKDPSSDEILVRKVEGAEASPKPVFQAPLPNTRAPRTLRMKRQVSSQKLLHKKSTSSSSSRSSSPTTDSVNKYNLRKKRSSSSSRRSSSSGSCSSHPMASSTLIMEPSMSPEKDEETGSVYTWSIEEGSETCNLERSFLRSQSERKHKNKNNSHTPRPPTNIGRDSSDISDFEEMNTDKSSFEITAMVSAIDKSSSSSVFFGQQEDSFCEMTSTPAPSKQRNPQVLQSLPRTSTRSTIPGRGIVSAAPNLRNRFSRGSSSHGSSSSSSNQPSTPSSAFNRAKGSIDSIPTSSSDEQNEALSDNNLKSLSLPKPNLLKAISASAPDLAHHYNFNEEPDASHSLEPSDTDSTPEILSSVLDDRSDIPGKSNSSGSSSCTAARCRPRVLPRADGAESTILSPNSQQSRQEQSSDQQQPQSSAAAATAQDLMDSILTDSPKSVDSSGIFAPYNSYNSPAESVGSHNGYSSTVSSSVPSSDSYYPISARIVQGQQLLPPHVATSQVVPPPPAAGSSEDSVFKRPFSPAPHIDRTMGTPVTRSQGVNVTASSSSTPTRPMSVRSDPLANKSFAVPPGVVTGPPKISNKKSLVKKLKKFSTNFYKKGEKIQTLTYL